ncbi:hypothetical protein C0216_03135 [Streptomyces globosus]|uniref:Uncharacterized protein n=1 Tax=Streptomyces globosus TaxID=68209 RepID=A0A344TV95_9ACTN|nr:MULTISPECIES: hypothetical protein [Streptomyces]AXE22566.1 hypothetical protein C0216_03135 [Streptomyces globosus]
MSTGAAPRDHRPAAVPMGTLLAACAAATAVSTPPAREQARPVRDTAAPGRGAAARGPLAQPGPESEAA